jgi:hypothetical protein
MDYVGQAPDPDGIRAVIPQEVADQVHNPAVALLVTLYILHMGQIVGEEMAGTVGFPAFPAGRPERIGLMRHLGHQIEPQRAVDIVEELGSRLSPAAVTAVNAEKDMSDEERILAMAILEAEKRTDQQGRVLSRTLSAIASGSAHGRDDLEDWEPGIKGIARITRLMIEAVPPTEVGTMNQLKDQNSGLRAIATLGGALFLGPSLQVLAEAEPAGARSRYAELGIRLADLTRPLGGRSAEVLKPADTAPYKNGLQEFALRGGSVFAIEHPFHFRVLLEVMSDENRRYPAEPVLNVEAMRHIWPADSLWSNIVWSRDQLPVVANLIRHPDSQRADAFIQHYAAFGRTPHTSSFTHLDYEVLSPVSDNPALASWPVAFQGYRGRPVQNMPNSVCEATQSITRQQRLGRLWRGMPEDGDLSWLCSQLVIWDEHRESDGMLAARIWRSSSWLGHSLPVAAMAEIRTGAWLLEALRLRLAAAVSPAGDPGVPDPRQERHDPEFRATEELRCVLEIMVLFSDDYIAGDGDGIPGLKNSLHHLRSNEWFTEMGQRLSSKLGYLEDSLDAFGDQLTSEVTAARAALASSGHHPGLRQ